jgi:CBS domain-containing protein
MHVLDIMIKKHIRRLPVVSEEGIEGMVYLSDLFYFLVDRVSR